MNFIFELQDEKISAEKIITVNTQLMHLRKEGMK